MKKTLSYPELWRKKQRELPAKGNPDTEWLKIRARLEQRMPASGVVKKPSQFKLPKWGLKVLVGVSAAAAVYLAGRVYFSKKQHDPAKPGIQQIHRDSLAPATNGILPIPGNVKPAGRTNIQVTPGVIGAGPRITYQSKPNSNTTPQHPQMTIDSINAPAVLNAPVHRDSLLPPVESTPLKPPVDSIGTVDLKKRDVQKDTSNSNKKTPRKKRRSKVSVFF